MPPSLRSQPIPAALAIVLVCGACAHDVHRRFPAPPDAPTGTLALHFTEAASSVAVAVNGVLVVGDEHTQHVVIEDVPTGYAEVAIAAGPGEKQVRVWIDADRVTTVPVGAAGEAPLSAIRSLAVSLASVALYALLR